MRAARFLKTPEESEADAEFRGRIEDFYQRHNAEKLNEVHCSCARFDWHALTASPFVLWGQVPGILRDFKGKEDELIESLCTKYNLDERAARVSRKPACATPLRTHPPFARTHTVSHPLTLLSPDRAARVLPPARGGVGLGPTGQAGRAECTAAVAAAAAGEAQWRQRDGLRGG